MDFKLLFRKKLYVSLILSILVGNIFAQETATSYEIIEEDNKITFTQTLTWDPVQYSNGYEIIIERQDNNNQWVSIENPTSVSDETKYIFETTENEYEMSLYAGKYRYKIYVLNLLNQIEAESEYFYFEIKKALQPQIKDFSPKTIYLDLENDGIFAIDGFNLLSSDQKDDSTNFYFQSITDPTNQVFYSDILEASDKKAKVIFNIDSLKTDEYTLIATNPGGLYSEFSTLTVKFEKLIDFNVSVGYSPSYFIPQGLLKEYISPKLLPFGAKAKLTFIPFKTNIGYFGIEISGYFSLFKELFETYDIHSSIIPVTINAVYQFPIIKKKLLLDTHIGGGLTLLNNVFLTFDSGVESPPKNVLGCTINGGLSLQYYFTNRLHMELGADYLFSIITDATFHMINPTLSIGWQF